jgi:hypothetical protein
LRRYLGTLNGPAQVWFSADGRLAFVASQKVPQVEVIHVDYDTQGRSRPTSKVVVDISAQDPAGFTPFLKRERARAVRAILAHLGAAAPDRPGPAPPEPDPAAALLPGRTRAVLVLRANTPGRRAA